MAKDRKKASTKSVKSARRARSITASQDPPPPVALKAANLTVTGSPDMESPAIRKNGGRTPGIDMKTIGRGIVHLGSQPRMKVESAREELHRKFGIDEKKGAAMYRMIIEPAYRGLCHACQTPRDCQDTGACAIHGTGISK
jgi:hypothetical protein